MAIAEFAPRHAGINVEPPAATRNTWKPVTATPGSTWVSKSFRAPVTEPPMEAFDSGAVVEALFDPSRPDPEAERRQVLDAINDALTRFNLANDDNIGRKLRSLAAELSANAISTAQARMELDGYVARLQRQNPAAGFSAIDAFRAAPSPMPSEPSPATPVVPNLFAPTPWRATLPPGSEVPVAALDDARNAALRQFIEGRDRVPSPAPFRPFDAATEQERNRDLYGTHWPDGYLTWNFNTPQLNLPGYEAGNLAWPSLDTIMNVWRSNGATHANIVPAEPEGDTARASWRRPVENAVQTLAGAAGNFLGAPGEFFGGLTNLVTQTLNQLLGTDYPVAEYPIGGQAYMTDRLWDILRFLGLTVRDPETEMNAQERELYYIATTLLPYLIREPFPPISPPQIPW